MSTFVAVLILLLAAGLLAAPAPAAGARKAVVVGIDGVRWDTLRAQMAAGSAPNLRGLARRGLFTPVFLPSGGHLGQTLSGPSWNTILRGVWQDKHGVASNEDCSYARARHPDFLTRLERSRPSVSTFAASTWPNITTSASCGPYVVAGSTSASPRSPPPTGTPSPPGRPRG